MWSADRWKDYEVYDTSNGEKLERWGDYILVRPDPQVIWNTPHEHPGWKKKNGHYHRSSKGGGEWEFFGLPQEWCISYHLPETVGALPLQFHLKPFAFKISFACSIPALYSCSVLRNVQPLHSLTVNASQRFPLSK